MVIPARGETGLLGTIESLGRCAAPRGAVEVLVVLNSGEHDRSSVREINDSCARDLERGRAARCRGALALQVLRCESLARRHAGVGLARKLGMDEALARLLRAGNPDGLIVSLDADCTVDRNYLRAIEDHFSRCRSARSAVLHFEHRLGPGVPRRAMVRYELYLRYVVNALRWSGGGPGFHTIGSCFAVRGAEYAAAGGMNRRQAGEDFYFLNKLAQRGRVTEIRDTCVRPLARVSDRTPFGTGRAIAEQGRGDGLAVYDPESFAVLRAFIRASDAWFSRPGRGPVPGTLRSQALFPILAELGIVERLEEINANVASLPAYRKRLRGWFDGFRTVRCLNWLARERFAPVPVETAAETLLHWLPAMLLECCRASGPGDRGRHEDRAGRLLGAYRKLDRSGVYAQRTCDGSAGDGR